MGPGRVKTQADTKLTLKELLVQCAVVLVLLVAMFPGVFLHREVTPPGTLLFDTAPWAAYAPEGEGPPKNLLLFDTLIAYQGWYIQSAQALDGGEWPLWNPLEFAGMPLMANYQTAVFYPFRLLHVFLPDDIATTLFILLKFGLCGITSYLCGRGVGLAPGGARFFSVAWMLGGYVTTWGYWSLGDTAAWFPILFLGVEWILNGRYKKGFYAAVLGAVLILLAGHPETAFSMSAGLGLYFFLRLLLDSRLSGRRLKTLGTAAVVWGVALLVCAIQLAPFIEFLLHSHTFSARPEGEGFNVFIQPGGLIAFWMPRFFGFTADGNFWGRENSNFVSMIYMGVAVWFGLCGLLAQPKKGGAGAVRFLCLALPSFLGALMAFNFPLVRPLLALPVVSSTVGSWHMAFPLFALPLLGAFGIEHWVSRPRSPRNVVLLLPAVLVPCVFFVALRLYFHEEVDASGTTAYITTQCLIFASFAAATYLVMALHCFGKKPAVVTALLVVVLAADLYVARRDLHESAPRKWHFFDTTLTSYLQDLDVPSRVSAQSLGMRPGLLQPYNVAQLWGYDGIYPARILKLFDECGGEPWARVEPICAVSHYLFKEGSLGRDDEVGPYKYLATMDGVDVYRNKAALPRAYLVGRVRVVSDEAELFNAMRSPEFEPSREAITDSPPRENLPESERDNLGVALIRTYEANRVVLDVEAEDDGILVLADAYYPGWTVTVDNEKKEIFPVFHAFRGVIVPKGPHRVEFRYEPLSFRIGLIVSTVALLASLLVAAYSLAIRMRTGQTHERG